MSTQSVNVARFARNVKWGFFCDFQTPCFCCTQTLLGSNLEFLVKHWIIKIYAQIIHISFCLWFSCIEKIIKLSSRKINDLSSYTWRLCSEGLQAWHLVNCSGLHTFACRQKWRFSGSFNLHKSETLLPGANTSF